MVIMFKTLCRLHQHTKLYNPQALLELLPPTHDPISYLQNSSETINVASISKLCQHLTPWRCCVTSLIIIASQ